MRNSTNNDTSSYTGIGIYQEFLFISFTGRRRRTLTSAAAFIKVVV